MNKRRGPLLAALAAAFAVQAFGFGPAAAADLTPEDVTARIAARTATVHAYRAHVDLKLRLRSFPFLSNRLTGKTFFMHPGRYQLVLDRPPSYVKGFEKLCSDLADVTSWNDRYTITLAPDERIDGKQEIVLRLVQRVRGMIDHEDVSVDPESWRIDRIVWHYYNGGTIAMSQNYKSVGPFVLLAAQHAEIAIPHVRAVAEAVYSDYRTNISFEREAATSQP